MARHMLAAYVSLCELDSAYLHVAYSLGSFVSARRASDDSKIYYVFGQHPVERDGPMRCRLIAVGIFSFDFVEPRTEFILIL